MNETDVAVLGGGISGLTCGFLLARRGLSVSVFEKTPRPGGCIRTWREGGFLFELGPNTVLDNAFEIDALCEAAGLRERRLDAGPSSKKRWIVKGGELVPLPAGLLTFLGTRLFPLRAKLRLLAEPFVRPAPEEVEESIAQFTRRRLGPAFLDYAVGPFVSGVYAGDPEKLSVRHATAKIHALEARYGSLIRGALAKRKGPAPAGGLFSFPEGLEELPRRLAERLGEGWRPESRVVAVEREGPGYTVIVRRGGVEEGWRCRAAACALPAAAAAEVLAPLGGELPARIGSLPYADVAVVSLGLRREQVSHPLDGFGFLAPEKERRYLLGCLFPSALFPGRAPAGHVALAAFTGGALHPERVAAAPEGILAAALEDLRPLLDLRGDPVLARVEVWRPAIPQYVVGHGEIKEEALRFEEAHPGVFISGNLLHGVSVADCIRNATALAGRVEAHLRAVMA